VGASPAAGYNKMSNDDSSTNSSSESRLARRRRRRWEKRERKKKKERKRDDRKRKSSSRISSDDDSIDLFDRERRRRRKKEKKYSEENNGQESRKSVGEAAESDEREASATVSNIASVGNHRVKIEACSSEKQPPPNKKIQSDPTELNVKRNAMMPMTREQHEAQQSQIREVYDEESGRYRLVRGTGEIIERIVSRSDHFSIGSFYD